MLPSMMRLASQAALTGGESTVSPDELFAMHVSQLTSSCDGEVAAGQGVGQGVWQGVGQGPGERMSTRRAHDAENRDGAATAGAGGVRRGLWEVEDGGAVAAADCSGGPAAEASMEQLSAALEARQASVAALLLESPP